jgi:hypothetical protein
VGFWGLRRQKFRTHAKIFSSGQASKKMNAANPEMVLHSLLHGSARKFRIFFSLSSGVGTPRLQPGKFVVGADCSATGT